MACLLESVCTIVGVFHQYAEKHGDCLTLNRRDMKRLLQKEFAEVLENPQDPQTVKLALQLLDVNRDSLVDFHEYLRLVFEVAMASYNCEHPKEGLPRMEDSCRRVHRNDNDGRHLREDGREEDRVHERRDSDGAHLHPTEDNTRGEMTRRELPREPSTHVEDRNHQSHDLESRDDDLRDRPSCEHQKWETERRCLVPKRQEVIERHRDAHGVEPRRDESAEEGYHCHSRDYVRRWDDERDRAHDPLEGDEDRYSSVVSFRREDERPEENEPRESEENLFRWHESEARRDEDSHRRQISQDEIRSAIERGRSSHELREREDGRRDLDARGELRSRDLEHHVTDERRDRMRNHTPVDDYEELSPLPREGGRRSCETGPRESEPRRRQSYSFQSREDEQRANQARNPEVRGSERRHDEDDWSRPRPREAGRPEVEGHPRRHDLERRERERSSLRPSDLGNTDNGSRRSHDLESRGGVRRSQWAEEHERRRQPYSWGEMQETDGGRRRPQSSEPEPRTREYGQDSERRRPQPHESAQREDHQGRHPYYETESWDNGRDRRRPVLLEPEIRNVDRRRLSEPASRYRERVPPQETDSRMRRGERGPSDGGRRELDVSRPQWDSRGRETERSRSKPQNLESSGKD